MKNLRLFETETAYNSVVSEFEYPTVSFVQDVEEVRYMTLRDKYTREYLTFEALENGTFTLTVPANVNSTYMTSVSYSTDNGATWTDTAIDNTAQTITTPTINAGDKVLWKGMGKRMAFSTSTGRYSQFSSTGNFNVSGNIMSLLYGDEFANQVAFSSDSTYNLCFLFRNNNKLISIENLILPATTLAHGCYDYMFNGCTSLTTAPELPATTLANSCYQNMFSNCTSLTTPPALPATTLAQYCYASMFDGCRSLTTAPVLPATTLATSCYSAMFSGCTSLTTAPELPATTMADACYSSMFNGCMSLTTAPELPATTLANNCYQAMFQGCTALTTAPVLPATTLADRCYNSMFNSCTSLTTTPVLPATTLVQSCYTSMFSGCTALTTASEICGTTLAKNCCESMFYSCTSLTTAPVLPATTLVQSCYSYMFNKCKKLNYIKAMFTTTPSGTYTGNWVTGVAATGTFVKNSAAQWNVTGISGIPSGWTVQTASA